MANVNIRVDDTLKRDAECIFSALGLSMSAATNAFYKQVVRYGGIPFELRIIPNEKPDSADRLTLEKVFSNWNGDAPAPYDWDDMDAPAGRELL